MSLRRARSVLVLATWVIVAGCSGGGGKSGECEGGTCGQDAAAQPDGGGSMAGPMRLKGRVFDAQTGLPIAKSDVKSSSGKIAKTDAAGGFELDVGDESGELAITCKEYAPTQRPAPKGGGYVEVFIKGIDKKVEFEADKGAKVDLGTGESLSIPANAVVDADGKAVKGSVTLELSAVNGRKRSEASAVPGDGKAQSKAKKEGRVSIEAGLSIRLVDKDGAELNVDKKAAVYADVPVRNNLMASKIGVYSYDEKAQTWVEEGEAPVEMVGGKAKYRAQIEHLSWWALGSFFDEIGCVQACVEDAKSKEPIAGAQVWVVGATHPGVSTFFSDDSGCGSAEAIANGQVVLVGQTEQLVSDAKVVIAGARDAKCGDGGVLALGKGGTAGCPGGFIKCGEACVDPSSDAANCGACDEGCRGLAGRERVCIAGECGCPEGDDICVNIASDAVRGSLVDQLGLPATGVTVKVGNQQVIPGEDGLFAFDGVAFPYDLIIADEGGLGFDVYLDVTRQDPRVVIYGNAKASEHTTTIAGAVTGVPDQQAYPQVGVFGPFTAARTYAFAPDFLYPYQGQTFGVGWNGPSSVEATLFAVQTDFQQGVLGVGWTTVTLQDGVALTSPASDIVMSSDFATRTVSGTVTALDPQSYASGSVRLDQYSLGNYQPELDNNTSFTASFNLPLGLPEAVPVALTASAYGPNGSVYMTHNIDPTETAFAIVLPVPPTVTGPNAILGATSQASAAQLSNSDVLVTSSPEGMVPCSSFSWLVGGESSVYVNVYSPDGHFPVSLLGELGTSPDGATVRWYPQASGPSASLDDLLSPLSAPGGDSMSASGSANYYFTVGQ